MFASVKAALHARTHVALTQGNPYDATPGIMYLYNP